MDGTTGGPGTRFYLLGPFEVATAGRPVDVAGARQARLLALLAVATDGVVPFDRIADAMWEEPPLSARQQVHNAVAAVRRSLAKVNDVELLTTAVGYRLRAPKESVDAYAFRRHVYEADLYESKGRLWDAARNLRAGLALWRGPAMAGLAAGSRSIQAMADQLDDERLTSVERLVLIELRLGSAHSLIAELARLVSENPLRESLRGSLMLALYQAGRQAEALGVFQEGRRILADELGLDPSAPLREIHARILRGEAANRVGPDSVRPAYTPFLL